VYFIAENKFISSSVGCASANKAGMDTVNLQLVLLFMMGWTVSDWREANQISQ
jgi:hypothetical protein